jgi:preprotein translocase subunit SecD
MILLGVVAFSYLILGIYLCYRGDEPKDDSSDDSNSDATSNDSDSDSNTSSTTDDSDVSSNDSSDSDSDSNTSSTTDDSELANPNQTSDQVSNHSSEPSDEISERDPQQDLEITKQRRNALTDSNPNPSRLAVLWESYCLEKKYKELEHKIPYLDKSEWKDKVRQKINDFLDDATYQEDPTQFIATKRSSRTKQYYAVVEDTALNLLEFYEKAKLGKVQCHKIYSDNKDDASTTDVPDVSISTDAPDVSIATDVPISTTDAPDVPISATKSRI